MDDRGNRLFDSLPGIFRASDQGGDLRRLLDAFDAVLFGRQDRELPGIEEEIDGIARHFAPMAPQPGDEEAMCPDRFLPWLAQWVAFSPYALFEPPQLRRIVAGIVPLYTRRGTRAYLEQLLRLCFDEIDQVAIDDAPVRGLRVGHARIGQDTLLGGDRPFWFRVDIGFPAGQAPPGSLEAFEQRVRLIIDFAKPAHTAYELSFRPGALEQRADETADPSG